jgi:hypothetical protein
LLKTQLGADSVGPGVDFTCPAYRRPWVPSPEEGGDKERTRDRTASWDWKGPVWGWGGGGRREAVGRQ